MSNRGGLPPPGGADVQYMSCFMYIDIFIYLQSRFPTFPMQIQCLWAGCSLHSCSVLLCGHVISEKIHTGGLQVNLCLWGSFLAGSCLGMNQSVNVYVCSPYGSVWQVFPYSPHCNEISRLWVRMKSLDFFFRCSSTSCWATTLVFLELLYTSCRRMLTAWCPLGHLCLKVILLQVLTSLQCIDTTDAVKPQTVVQLPPLRTFAVVKW